MKQYEAVEKTVRNLGGYATLRQIDENIFKIKDCKWGTKTPFASIRRIVQTYPQIFFKIRPGLWGLTERKDLILNELGLPEGISEAQIEEKGHSYYQGLILEIGNRKGFKTFAPKQDRNKLFLKNIRVGDKVSLDNLPQFTYNEIVNKAKTVDVVWFNEDSMFPCAFYEIEHTTDFRNSLNKFYELHNFRADFNIVSNKIRFSEYSKRINDRIYHNIRTFINFHDYDKIVQSYES